MTVTRVRDLTTLNRSISSSIRSRSVPVGVASASQSFPPFNPPMPALGIAGSDGISQTTRVGRRGGCAGPIANDEAPKPNTRTSNLIPRTLTPPIVLRPEPETGPLILANQGVDDISLTRRREQGNN